MRSKTSSRGENELWNVPADPQASELASLEVRKSGRRRDDRRAAEVAEEIRKLQAPFETQVTARTLNKVLK
jgi:hypothetical protein